MRAFLCTFSLFFIFGTQLSYAAKTDYYWRDYTGEIPEDAIPGGLDKDKRTIYIGQVLILKEDNKQGLIPVAIYKGNKSVTAELFGVHTTDEFIKILCSQKDENFEWHNAKAIDLHLTTIGKHLVPGGVEDGKTLNIGRTQYEGQLIIGKVLGGFPGDAKFYFPHGNNSTSADSYQVLIYNENLPELDIRGKTI